MTELRNNCAKTTPQIFIIQYILMKERRKKGFTLYYKVITQSQPEI